MRAAATQLVTPGGVLAEPCSNCDNDQLIFKGVWVRHAAYLAQAQPAAAGAAVAAFLGTQAASLLGSAGCSGGGFGLLWQGPCGQRGMASDSAALDLLLAAAATGAPPPPSAAQWAARGVGACVDAQGRTMNTCSAVGATEAACRAAAAADALAAAYDFEQGCLGLTVCRVRTAAAECGTSGFSFAAGTGATAVTNVDGADLTVCVVRT